MPTNKDVQLKTIVDFARRKGIVYPSSEIYGGFAATYDFGPLGKLLKDNLVNAWRDWMVNYRTDTVEIEGAIFLHPKVWTASGHVGGFSDLLVEDLVTHKRYRADHLVEEAGVVWPILMNNEKLKTKDESVILIDAIDSLIVDKDGDFEVNAELLRYLDSRNERKILVTNAKGEVLNKVKSLLVDTGIEIFSKGFEPEKTNPEYFKLLSQELGVDLSKVFYFDHSQANLNSAKSAGVANVLLYTGDVVLIKESISSSLRDITPQEGNSTPQILTDAGSLSAEEIDQIIEHYKIKSPEGNPLSKARKFNLLVKTHLGPVEDDSSLAYLKGEACANTYVDWKAVQETTRRKLPFGIAQMGKAFRNEINVKQYMFRTREFEQIDMEFFVKPPEFVKKDAEGNNLEKDHLEWFSYWKEERYNFYTEFLGYNPENLKWHQHTPEELVFYCVEAWDVYYNFGALGYKEMEGVHNRTDYDTRQHQQYSGTDLTYLDPETNQRYLPYVVEMSLGVNRLFLSCLFEFYKEEIIDSSAEQSKEEEARIVFKLPYKLAPYKIAILPLMKKDGMKEKAEEIYISLKKQGISCDYDDAGSIGKRYRRQDENGTPWCMCIDYETIKEGELQDTVTLRNRDTMEQIRVKLSEIDSRFLSEKL